MGNKTVLIGGNAFTQFGTAITGGNAAALTVGKVIRGGSASYEKSDEWFEERKEIRRIKRKVRHSFTNRSSFEIELMSYGIIREQPVLRRSYLKKLVKR